MSRDLLVIDDETVVRDAIALVCGAEGLDCALVDRADDGLTLLADGGFRLVLCDLMMPGTDGFGFLEAARRRSPGSPVVMITGFATRENAVRSLSAGAIDFLAKPFTSEELLSVVRRGLRYGELERAGGSLPFVPCPSDRYRLGYVSWVRREPREVVVGVNDAFVRTLGAVRGIDLAKPGEELIQGMSCASLTGADGSRNAVLGPVTGRVLEANPRLSAEPALVEKDPYREGWLYRLAPSELQPDLERLSDAGQRGATP